MVLSAGQGERLSLFCGGQYACPWPVTGHVSPSCSWPSTGGCVSGSDMARYGQKEEWVPTKRSPSFVHALNVRAPVPTGVRAVIKGWTNGAWSLPTGRCLSHVEIYNQGVVVGADQGLLPEPWLNNWAPGNRSTLRIFRNGTQNAYYISNLIVLHIVFLGGYGTPDDIRNTSEKLHTVSNLSRIHWKGGVIDAEALKTHIAVIFGIDMCTLLEPQG